MIIIKEKVFVGKFNYFSYYNKFFKKIKKIPEGPFIPNL